MALIVGDVGEESRDGLAAVGHQAGQSSAWRPTSDNPAPPPVLSLAERVWPGRPDDAAPQA
ncbi:hypothetical protein [Rhodococcus sp. JVH1]|uniref:hypothetical protein n=1 Tax=Rhodococcus sp. JVH1 TaxID=745408 RepID=UPI000271E057|nr:hypothetical protein [Rhodococcus sp. JVH1]EJI97980.1 hypothetical protein JVH1_4514 [Rhodococcus sp. JVH1]